MSTPAAKPGPKRPVSERLRELWPDIRALVYPRRGLLFIGFLLIVVRSICGLVLPYSSKYLIDNVIGKRQGSMLPWIVLAVLVATLIQGIASFTLTQLLSIEGQKVIAELRQKVQAH